MKRARGKKRPISRRTRRANLQSRPRYPAGNPGREREESGPPGARLFCVSFRLQPRNRRPETKSRKPEAVNRIAIVGGGISGLAAAFSLEEHCRAEAVE